MEKNFKEIRLWGSMCFIPGQMECRETENGGRIPKATEAFTRHDNVW